MPEATTWRIWKVKESRQVREGSQFLKNIRYSKCVSWGPGFLLYLPTLTEEGPCWELWNKSEEQNSKRNLHFLGKRPCKPESVGEITFFFFFRPNLRPLSAFELHKYLEPQEEKFLQSKECGGVPLLLLLLLWIWGQPRVFSTEWENGGDDFPLRELHFSDQKNREEEGLEAKERGSSHWRQGTVEMDPLTLRRNRHGSELRVCGAAPRKHSKGFEAWPSPRLISKWCMCRKGSEIVATVLRTELDSQPTISGQELPICT